MKGTSSQATACVICRVWSQTPEEFRQDASRARELLEDVGGVSVTGYRAASWSIDKRTPWAHEILAEIGYKYSSSVYPISHDHYGVPDAPRHPHVIDGTGITEIPPSTARLLGRNIPVSGGGYFRLFPLSLSKRFINKHQQSESYPVCLLLPSVGTRSGATEIQRRATQSTFSSLPESRQVRKTIV